MSSNAGEPTQLEGLDFKEISGLEAPACPSCHTDSESDLQPGPGGPGPAVTLTVSEDSPLKVSSTRNSYPGAGTVACSG
eukprot:1403173-Rhodomonas_salina.1